MSTPRSGLGTTGPSVPVGAPPLASPGVGTDPRGEELTRWLAAAAVAFADTFERWSSRKAVEAGASVPRLRLLYSVHCHGAQKMADLADALAVTPRNVTALVDGLEAEGMVRRVPHSTDRRVTLVELTCNSDRVATQFQTYQDSIAGLFSDLDEADERTLLRLLGTLHDRMRAQAAPATAQGETFDA
jgi:DNA-binding MarR family transcriptional regulator